MSISQPLEVALVEPARVDAAVLEKFVQLVELGGEVSTVGLKDRVRRAEVLATVQACIDLVGVAALKRPNAGYIRKLEAKTGTSLATYPLELGWVFVAERARGRGVSAMLCKALLEARPRSRIFATSRLDNERMARTLLRCGFRREAGPYQSDDERRSLQLFVYGNH